MRLSWNAVDGIMQRAVKRGLSRREALPAADSKIAFDRFHVAQYMGKAEDQLRRQEHRCSELRQSSLKTARAWAIKGLASCLWDNRSRTWAKKGWKRLINWMARSRLKPMQTTSKTLRITFEHTQRSDFQGRQQSC